ncbi:MAG: hypothetical protein ACI4I9_07720 [Porcipelethomonas sp.]
MSEISRFNECDAVPIKVDRVFDSCSDKDCISGVPVTLSCEIPENITIVKSKCITVSNICMNVEPIPFNKGFYSVDLTFSFDVQLLGYAAACYPPVLITGTATVSKSCVLFGSETNSRTFYSTGQTIGSQGDCCNTVNPPTAVVQAVSPIVLEAKLSAYRDCEQCTETCRPPKRGVLLTLGLFYVVELTRPVTLLVPTYDYTIPEKECCSDMDSPCEIFDKIKFPTEEFSPAKLENNCSGGSCCRASITPIETIDYDSSCGCSDD